MKILILSIGESTRSLRKRTFHVSWTFAYCGIENLSVIPSRCCLSPYRSWRHLSPPTTHTVVSFPVPFLFWPFPGANLSRTFLWILAYQVFVLTRYFRDLALSLKYFPMNKNKNSWHMGAKGRLRLQGRKKRRGKHEIEPGRGTVGLASVRTVPWVG